ncbi:MAG: hypothetical protein JSV98_10695 [candidate division WOR-3 bacterium]|nr:MAG: hypothetical protein JSV98_10695 [candidate division WOR-3 bacterium]
MKRFLAACLMCAMVWIACEGEDEAEAPQVEITFPVDGSVVSGTVEITADATDDSVVVSVEFYIDDSLVSTDTAAPYAHTWSTAGLVDSSTHTIYATAYDDEDNEGVSPTISVMVYNGFYEADNFNSYTSSSPLDTVFALLDGNGNWSATDWNVMREEIAFDSNYIMVREFPVSSHNEATYHLTAQANIVSLSVGFAYIEEANAEIYVLISPDDTTWVDVTDQFNISTNATPTNTSADLTTFVAGYGPDAYIRFEAEASGGTNWYCAVDDFWVSGTVE